MFTLIANKSRIDIKLISNMKILRRYQTFIKHDNSLLRIQ
jgi:hypothetical protein